MPVMKCKTLRMPKNTSHVLCSGLHGYSHEASSNGMILGEWTWTFWKNPVSMTLEQQRDILDHTYKLLTDFNNGIPPKGSVAPWWETSKEGSALLLDKGVEYGQDALPLISAKVLTCFDRPLQYVTWVCLQKILIHSDWNYSQFSGVLPSWRRYLDKDWLQGPSSHVDEATAKGQWNGTRWDSC